MTEAWRDCPNKDFLQMVKESLENQIESLHELIDAREKILSQSNVQIREDFVTLRNQVIDLLNKVQQLEQSMTLALGDEQNSGILQRIEDSLDGMITDSNERIDAIEKVQDEKKRDWTKTIGVCSGLCAIVYAISRLIITILPHIK